MISVFFRYIRKQLAWRTVAHKLDHMSKLEEFEAYVEEAKPALFLDYGRRSAEKRLEFETVLEKLQINPKGMKFLDIGPAYGDSLDICHERGASAVDFIDYDLFFYTYNRLKGYRSYRLNHLKRLDQMETGKYDLIWAKSCFSAGFFITRWRWFANLDKWLEQIERIAAPDSKVIICPYWQNKNGIRYIRDVRNNRFTRTMLEHGYRILRPIKNCNKEPAFPLIFLRDDSQSVPECIYE